MPSADGDYVKVYLCALYHCQQGDSAFTLQDMALELGLALERVEAALRYWERRRLLSRVSEQPLQYRLYHLGQRMLTGQDGMSQDGDYVAFSEAVYALFHGRRKIRPNEIATAYEWVKELLLPQEVVLMLLSHSMDTRGSNFSFKSAQSLAVAMREANITGTDEAEDYLNHSKQAHEGARAVLRRFNLRRLPTQDELALYRKWTMEWGFQPDAILSACTETVKAANPSFGYLNGVLEGLLRRGAGSDARQVSQHIQQESEGMKGAQEVLAALGTRISPHTVLKAYETLRHSAPHALIVEAAVKWPTAAAALRTSKSSWPLARQGSPRRSRPAKPRGTPSAPGKTVAAQRYTSGITARKSCPRPWRDAAGGTQI